MSSSQGWALGAGMEVEPRLAFCTRVLHSLHTLAELQEGTGLTSTGGQAEMRLQCGCPCTGRRETQLQLGSHHGPADLFQQWFLTALTECGLSPKGRAQVFGAVCY